MLLIFLVALVCMETHFPLVSGETLIRCMDREREALLEFKRGVTDDPYNILESWGSDEHQKECCEWYGVECSDTATAHVTALVLGGNSLKFGGNISASLVELNHLNELDLSWNDFGGIRIPKFIGSIKSLHHLHLSSSNFSGNIPLEIGNLTNLITLDLSSNDLDSSKANGLANISLGYSTLDFWNHLKGPIPYVFGRLTSLQSIDLSGNMLEGGIPKSFGNLTHLRKLSLYYNNLGVQLEDLLGNISASTQLVSLQLSQTGLTGSVSTAGLGQFSQLEKLDLSYNSLLGRVSEAHFTKLAKLKDLDLSSSSLDVDLSLDWVPPFQLERMFLASCKMGPSFPTWLHTQKKLKDIDLSNNNISDEVPKWFWDLSSYMYLNISQNQMSGTISHLSSIFILDVSSNKFSGPLPLLPPYAEIVVLSRNKFSGSNISSFVCKFFVILLLDLSNNQLDRMLPSCWLNMKALSILNLNNNNFSGEIPCGFGLLINLQTLHLRDNNLSGELPLTLKNCQHLKLIDIGGNKLTGNIPPWFGNTNYTSLMYLSLRHNRFYGGIPSDICNLNRLQMLDLSGNNISGKIPQCFNNFTSLVEKSGSAASSFISYRFGSTNRYIEYALVQWKYQEAEYRNSLGFLKLIDLSSNGLVGDIPRTLSSLKGLISLNLSRNSLTGHIDSTIGEMEMLECLDLSSNKLSGEIPIGLAQLHYLAVLNLANNNLSGKIPSGTQLQSFNASSYAGNNDLCGPPLKLCPQDHTPINNEDVEEEDNGIWRLSFMQEFGMMMTFGCIVGFWGVVGSLILKKSWRCAYFNFMGATGDWVYVRVILFINGLKRS